MGRSVFDRYSGPDVYYCVVEGPRIIDLVLPEAAVARLSGERETLQPAPWFRVELQRIGEYYYGGEIEVLVRPSVFCAPKAMVEERYREYRERMKRARKRLSKAEVIAAILRDIHRQSKEGVTVHEEAQV